MSHGIAWNMGIAAWEATWEEFECMLLNHPVYSIESGLGGVKMLSKTRTLFAARKGCPSPLRL